MSKISPIFTTVGNYLVDRSVVPYIRSLPMYIRGFNLRPYAYANYWFDQVAINAYVQPASFLHISSGAAANLFTHQEGVYCVNTHAYGVVCENSQGTILHIDENYLCMNVQPFGPNGSNSFASSDYAVGDVVYMSNNSPDLYSNTSMARVVYWDSANGGLALDVSHGTFSNTSISNVIFKVGSTNRANVVNFVFGDKFPIGGRIISVANTAKNFLNANYLHNHGVITRISGAGNQIQLSGKANANMVNQNIYLSGGYGIGQLAKIISVDTGTHVVTLNTSWVGHFGNSYYSIGQVQVDDIGIATSIFRIPEDDNAKFQSGSRLVTVNDGISHTDNAASMRALATYEASGTGPTSDSKRTPVVAPPPPLSAGSSTTTSPTDPTSRALTQISNDPQASADPLVQTFFTPKPNSQKTDYGIFCTSIDLFLQAKPTGNATHFPISVYIVETNNGFPTTKMRAQTTVRWEDVKTTDGVTTFPDSANSSTYTKFSFPDPVFLSPGSEYGLVVYSESPDYQVWIAQLGQTVVNSTRLVSQSPWVGALFKSQNASAWTPVQNQQLMFVLNKASFSNQSAALTFAVEPPTQNTFMDIALLHSGDLTFPAANILYGLKTTVSNTLAQDSGFLSVEVNSPYNFGGDLINSSLSSNRRRLIAEGNANSCLVQVTLNSSDPDVSPFFHAERLSLMSVTNVINNGSIANTDISMLTTGTHINAANIVVTFSAPTGVGGVLATANVLGLAGNVVTSSNINIINPGSGYIASPTITLSEPSALANATAQVYSEDGKFGGNGVARYITRQVTLADGFDAGDLAVFMNVIRPQGTDISVYYKVLSASDTDPLTNKNWKIMSKAFDVYSADQSTPIQLNFNTGSTAIGSIGSVSYVENGITYPIGGKFKSFSIKIVLTANDPTVAPVVQNFRAIAIPAG